MIARREVISIFKGKAQRPDSYVAEQTFHNSVSFSVQISRPHSYSLLCLACWLSSLSHHNDVQWQDKKAPHCYSLTAWIVFFLSHSLSALLLLAVEWGHFSMSLAADEEQVVRPLPLVSWCMCTASSIFLKENYKNQKSVCRCSEITFGFGAAEPAE